MNIFNELDNLLFKVPKAWIEEFLSDKELVENNHEKALAMSEAVSVTRVAGISMLSWTVGFAVVAPLVIASLPATWPLWAMGVVGLFAVGVTEALMTSIINGYLNRHETAKKWKSQISKAHTPAGKARIILGIGADCMITVCAAMIWALAAPVAQVGHVLSKILPQHGHKALRVVTAMFAYSLPFVTSIFRAKLGKRFRQDQHLHIQEGDALRKDEGEAEKPAFKDCSTIDNDKFEKLFSLENDHLDHTVKVGSILVISDNGTYKSLLVDEKNKGQVSAWLKQNKDKQKAVCSPYEFFELEGCKELRINRCQVFKKEVDQTQDSKFTDMPQEASGLKDGNVILFYPKSAVKDGQESPLDPTRCFFLHVTTENKKQIKTLQKNMAEHFDCRVLNTKDNGKDDPFSELLKDGVLASIPEQGPNMFAMVTGPGALWMGIGLAVGIVGGFLALGPIGALVGGLLAIWAVPAVLAPTTGLLYYKTKQAKKAIPKIMHDTVNSINDSYETMRDLLISLEGVCQQAFEQCSNSTKSIYPSPVDSVSFKPPVSTISMAAAVSPSSPSS